MLAEIRELVVSGKRGWENLESRRVRGVRNKVEILLSVSRAALDLMNITFESDESINEAWRGNDCPPMSPKKKQHLEGAAELLISKIFRTVSSKGGALYGEEHQIAGITSRDEASSISPYRLPLSDELEWRQPNYGKPDLRVVGASNGPVLEQE